MEFTSWILINWFYWVSFSPPVYGRVTALVAEHLNRGEQVKGLRLWYRCSSCSRIVRVGKETEHNKIFHKIVQCSQCQKNVDSFEFLKHQVRPPHASRINICPHRFKKKRIYLIPERELSKIEDVLWVLLGRYNKGRSSESLRFLHLCQERQERTGLCEFYSTQEYPVSGANIYWLTQHHFQDVKNCYRSNPFKSKALIASRVVTLVSLLNLLGDTFTVKQLKTLNKPLGYNAMEFDSNGMGHEGKEPINGILERRLQKQLKEQ